MEDEQMWSVSAAQCDAGKGSSSAGHEKEAEQSCR